ncbi:TVP38/TMEM64 family protein, partial [Mycobacterium tuberculosis]|uniref:TVP38/TMEM64 family protein n=1 Tax=Mycobacterium tuberculosis TaxID=1773 RepID=UPI00207B9E7D
TRHLCDPASFLGRRAGRNDAQALLGVDRAHRLDAQIERRGLWAVVGQRFVPGISDALASYTFGAFGVPLWQMVVGSFIGSAPRVFVYTALGASITNLSSPLVYSAIAVWCVTAIIGAFAARRWYRKWRARPRRRCGLAQLTTGSQQRHTSHRTPAGVVMPGSLSEHRRLRQEAPDRIEHHPPIE